MYGENMKKYNVNFLLSFARALPKRYSKLTKTMFVPELQVANVSASLFEDELQRSIAGLNEFPPEEVEVKVTAFTPV